MGSNQRYGRFPVSIPAWAATVGAMKESGAGVSASCSLCRHWKDQVDLDRIIEAKGEDFSLFDKRPPCPKRCGGTILFLYGPRPGKGPTRPCKTSRA